jgi:hypothetical protein
MVGQFVCGGVERIDECVVCGGAVALEKARGEVR